MSLKPNSSQMNSLSAAAAAAAEQPSLEWPRRLLDAYSSDHRDLPWRRTRDPYAIYVSEIMLQQTQVQTVIPYYERFLARYPDTAALAAADPDELHKYWEGLGYYARVRQMQQACVQIVAAHGGRLPDDPLLLRRLPGIGDYTVGALRSIAFGHAEPAVDGNVVRVIARLYARPFVHGSVADRAQAAKLLQPLIPTDRPGDFNQALMELGARVCTPARPRCPDCPLQPDCQAFRLGCTASLPLKQERKPVAGEELTLVALKIGPRYLVRRQTGTLLKGLYQFELLTGRLDSAAVSAWVREWLPPGWQYALTPLPARSHRFTHRLWQLNGYLCDIAVPAGTDPAWAAETIRAIFPPASTSTDTPTDTPAGTSTGISTDVPILVSGSELAALPFSTALAAYRADVLAAERSSDGSTAGA